MAWWYLASPSVLNSLDFWALLVDFSNNPQFTLATNFLQYVHFIVFANGCFVKVVNSLAVVNILDKRGMLYSQHLKVLELLQELTITQIKGFVKKQVPGLSLDNV